MDSNPLGHMILGTSMPYKRINPSDFHLEAFDVLLNCNFLVRIFISITIVLSVLFV